MDKEWMMETFPNYTEAMYMGNEPSYYNDYITGKGPHFATFYGTLDLTPEGEIWAANVTLGDKNNTIYIVGDNVELMHIPYDGISHYWKWTNKFCKTNNPFQFFGRINEDVNTYVQLGKLGKLFFTVVDCSLVQKTTQKNKGGMSDTYNDDGTYIKSFYTVMTNPSCVIIDAMATDHTRIHHKINWNCAVPKIINEKYKK